jgi:hypothetical protein
MSLKKNSPPDLRDSIFQESIMKVICLGKCFKRIIKEKSGLDEHANATEKPILPSFQEETKLLDTSSIATLKKHVMACYCQIRKDF